MTAHLPAIPDERTSVALLEYQPANPTGGRLVAWADAAGAAHRLGSALAKTSFVPKDFRGKPDECAAAILYGDEIGLTPMQAVQSVYVVSGRPGLYARAMLAIVLAAGHEVITETKTDAKVIVRGRRKGSDTWIAETWTTERARRAGYTTNKKYESDPQAMLLARAQSDICRQIAPDALAGLAYSVEELELAEQPPAARVVRNQSPTTSTVQRKAVAAVAPASEEEPSFDEPDSVDTVTGEIVEAEVAAETVPEAPAVDMISAPQTRMMGALMKELGITRREDALIYCIDVIRREVASRNELTKREATAVIDALNADKVAHDAALGLSVEPAFDEDGAA